jgi:hypothetical protein
LHIVIILHVVLSALGVIAVEPCNV